MPPDSHLGDVAAIRGTTGGQSHRHVFDNFSNPGGQPTIGNSSFSLTRSATPNGALLSVLGLSLGRGSLPVFGIDVLLDPSTLVACAMPMPVGTTATTYNQPIPNNQALVGFKIYAQAFCLGGGVWSPSGGLRVTVLP